MAFQDQYGFWYPQASYGGEVHVSDLVISFLGTHFAAFATAIVFIIPVDNDKKNNRYTWMSVAPISA